MSRGGNKVQTDVDSGVMVVEEGALYFQFLLQVVFELCVNVVHNGFKTVKNERESTQPFLNTFSILSLHS